MTIEQMISFLTVADCRNFTKAADHLHMTQPALSRIIAVVESEVGAVLLKRTKRSVEVTPAGREFQYHCKKLVDDYHRAIESIRACQKGIAGCVRIGFTSSAAERILPDLINGLRDEYPQIDIQLYDGTYFEIMELLNEKRLDAGILSDLAANHYPVLESRLISEDRHYLVVPDTHWAAKCKSVKTEQILQERFVTIDRNRSSIDAPVTERNLLTHTLVGIDNCLLNIVGSAKSIPSLLIMVACGVGVAVLAKHTEHHAPANVCYIPISDFGRTFNVSLVWNIENPNPYIAKIGAMLDQDLICGESKNRNSSVI